MIINNRVEKLYILHESKKKNSSVFWLLSTTHQVHSQRSSNCRFVFGFVSLNCTQYSTKSQIHSVRFRFSSVRSDKYETEWSTHRWMHCVAQSHAVNCLKIVCEAKVLRLLFLSPKPSKCGVIFTRKRSTFFFGFVYIYWSTILHCRQPSDVRVRRTQLVKYSAFANMRIRLTIWTQSSVHFKIEYNK